MWEALSGLLAIAFLILRFYLEGKKGGQYEEDMSEMESAIARGDCDTISRLFERMRSPGDHSDTGGQDDKKIG